MINLSLKDALINITRPLHSEVYESRDQWRSEAEYYHSEIANYQCFQEQLEGTIEALKFQACQSTFLAEKALKGALNGPLDDFCEDMYIKVDKFAYKNKMEHKGKAISVYPNEMIQPELFEVVNARSKIKEPDSRYMWYENVGRYVSNFKWTDDKDTYGVPDRYEYPNKAIIHKEVDCEGHSAVVSSLEPEIGIAYGYYIQDKKTKYGHAFNVFVCDEQLYILETTGTKAEIYKYPNPKYDIHWIFTQNSTYQCKARPVQFGIKA